MLINSINWLIDCKKDLTSRQPTKLHMAAILAGGLCSCVCLSGLWQWLSEEEKEEERDASWDVQRSGRLACSTGLTDEIIIHVTGELGNATSKNGGKPAAIMLMCVDFPHIPPLSVSVSLYA